MIDEAIIRQVPDHRHAQIAKLPKWAQSVIDVLARKVESEKKKMDQTLSRGPARVNLLDWEDMPLGEVERGLGDRADIRFYLSDPTVENKRREGQIIDCRIRDDALEIVAYNSALVISPLSSNVVQARCLHWVDLQKLQELERKS